MAQPVFIYGTLKRGFNLAWAMDGQRFLGEATTAPHYRMYNCGQYPGLVDCTDGIAIHGELWEVNDYGLVLLDEVEAVETGLFERRAIALDSPSEYPQTDAYFYCQSVDDLGDAGNLWN
ncbi:MAG: hypothetical protein CMJ78_14340 [Planctomycetaceae bacterium]|nr:hypothetical protein [Planctomycetaceae bacterium]